MEALEMPQHNEEPVSEELGRLAETFELQFADSLLLEAGGITAAVDHVVVDRRGILILQTEVRPSARIQGSDGARTWTATYRNGEVLPFANPLARCMELEEFVRGILKRGYVKMTPQLVSSAVVFVGAKLDDVQLRPAPQLRVAELARLEALLSGRANTTPSAEALSPERTAQLLKLIRDFDRTGDAQIVELHEERMRRRERGGAPASAHPEQEAEEDLDPRLHFGLYGPRRRSSKGGGPRASRHQHEGIAERMLNQISKLPWPEKRV